MDELKICPFCGNTNVSVKPDWEIELIEEEDATGYLAVICDINNGGCGATGGYRETKKESINAWNKRK